MATSIVFAFDKACAGGGHVDVQTAFNGGQPRFFRDMDLEMLRSSLSQDEREMFIQMCIRVHLAGRTRAQSRAALEAGFSVSITP